MSRDMRVRSAPTPFSPLLANIYLHQFDEWYRQRYAAPDQRTDPRGYGRWRYRREKGKDAAAVQMFRYADDWILLVRGTKAQAEEIKQACKAYLCDELGLDLSEEKTKITHIQDGVDFLGYRIFRCNRSSKGKRVGVFARPTAESQRRVKAKIKAMTGRGTLNEDYLLKIQAVNAVIRGWAMYYRAVNSSSTFQGIDQYVWLRLRTWLEKKHRCGPKQVRRRYMHQQPGPKGGMDEFAAQDAQGRWIVRYRASSTKLIYHRPWLKRSWPHPYLDPIPAQAYAYPVLDDLWEGNSRAPEYVANRRLVVQRAAGRCERCGQRARLAVHHRHRRHYGRRRMANSDNRPEMMEALCKTCHDREHRAEVVARNKTMARASAAARSA
jgi:RNA-directed DNA polymerase